MLSLTRATRELSGIADFNRRRRLFLLTVVATCLLQAVGPLPVLGSPDRYRQLTATLAGLVQQRSSLLQQLKSADGAVGALLARDALNSLAPALATQQSLVEATVRVLQPPPDTTRTPGAASSRLAAPGVLLGAHAVALPDATIDHSVPAVSPAQTALADATHFELASAVPSLIPNVARVGAVSLPALQAVPQSPPTQYATLGDAASFGPLHAVQVAGKPRLLQTLATDAGMATMLVPVSTPPISTIIPLRGVAAARAFDSAATGLTAILNSAAAAAPASLPSHGLSITAPVRSVNALAHALGSYSLAMGTPANSAPLASLSPTPLPNLVATLSGIATTWSFTATTPLTTSGAITTTGTGATSGSSMRMVTLQASEDDQLVGALTQLPSALSFSLAPQDTACVTVTTTLTDGTSLAAVALLHGLTADRALQQSLSTEQATLSKLGAVVRLGNAVYAQLRPLYDVRAQRYQASLAAAMRYNAVLEQGWWDRTRSWSAYQSALASWARRRDAWRRYLRSANTAVSAAPGANGQTGYPSPTPAGRERGYAQPVGQDVHSALLSAATPRAQGGGFDVAEGTQPFGQPITEQTPVGSQELAPPTAIPSMPSVAPATDTPLAIAPTSLPTSLPKDTPVWTATQVPPSPTQRAFTPTSLPFSPTLPPSSPTPRLFTPTLPPSPTDLPASATPTAPSASNSRPPRAVATASATDFPTQAPSTSTDVPSPTVLAVETVPPRVPAPSNTPTPKATIPSAVRVPSSVPASATNSAALPSATIPSPDIVASATATGEAANSAITATPLLQATATETVVAAGATGSPSPSATVPNRRQAVTQSRPLVVVVPPGPPPAYVPPPGPAPIYESLPAPIPPLPAWADMPVPVTASELSAIMARGIYASGYANMTAQQLIDAGALDNVNGYRPPLQGVITTYWGGSTPWQAFHPGLDIATAADTPVRASADGIVVYAGLAQPGNPTYSYGNCVLIMHNAHISTLYGHMDLGVHGLVVRPGEVVRQGQIIGYEGATGWATGPHVHFEMRLDNVQFDPLLLVNERDITG